MIKSEKFSKSLTSEAETSETRPTIRVRFAPSPTGYLHVGGARTALFNFLFSQKQHGTFVLRVEDTDEARSTEDALKKQLADLIWLGLRWDEGPDPDTLQDFGSYGPYRQSQRRDIYKKFAEQLISQNHAYYCFCTDQEIENMRESARIQKRPPHYDGRCRKLSNDEVQTRLQSGHKAAIRFKVPAGVNVRDFQLDDLVRGKVSFPSDMVGDFVILRSNQMPVYNFCCTIDDALMEISHVLRAEEHLSNTLRQLMLQDALGFSRPHYGHLSIILGEDRQKLSKRHGATSCNEYQRLGYLPEAMNNFLALLGWSSPTGKEILSMDELKEQFAVDRLNPAAAVFDEKKLKWMNAQHLRALPQDRLWELLRPMIEADNVELMGDEEWVRKVLALQISSIETLNDGVGAFKTLSPDGFKLSDQGNELLKWPTTRWVMEKWNESLLKELRQCNTNDQNKATPHFISEDKFEAIQEYIKLSCNVKGKNLFQPIRVAVIGEPSGPELKLLVPLIPIQELLRRVKICLESFA